MSDLQQLWVARLRKGGQGVGVPSPVRKLGTDTHHSTSSPTRRRGSAAAQTEVMTAERGGDTRLDSGASTSVRPALHRPPGQEASRPTNLGCVRKGAQVTAMAQEHQGCQPIVLTGD